MRYKNLFILVVLISLVGCSVQKPEVAAPMTLEGHLSKIMMIWPGSYSNAAQIAEVEKSGGKVWRVDDSGEGGYLDLTSHYILLDRPDIGEHVMYVEEYRDNMPSETYRQRIYTISVDEASQMIKVKMWPFKDKEKYIGSWEKIEMLESLTLEEINAFPDICDLHVKPQGDKYHMYMNGADCTFGTKTFNYEVMISKDVFSYRDKITDSEAGTVTSAADNAYHHLDRTKK